VLTNRLKEVVFPLEKPFNLYSRGSHKTVLLSTIYGVLNLLLHCPCVSLKE